ncbi:MAG: hypothetical protein NUV54_02180 [Candidatus Taylorbacteria bacterium]|nr:hypothetical protein [Candidatus Taylorbacteria bacterium]
MERKPKTMYNSSFIILPNDPNSVQEAKASEAHLANARPNERKRIIGVLIRDAQKKHNAALVKKDWRTVTATMGEINRLQRLLSKTKAEALIL